MRRLAYALSFAIVVGLVAGGLTLKPDRPDGRALLMCAAEAMAEAKTIHVRGRPNISDLSAGVPAPPWGFLGEGHYESWYSPEGTRTEHHDADGNLTGSLVMNVALGMAWVWRPPNLWFPEGLVTTYPVGTDALAVIVEHARQRYLRGEHSFAHHLEHGEQVTTHSGMRNGREVTVVKVDLGMDPSGLPVGTVECYLDPATGHLLGLRQYGPESHGKPLTADMETVEYGIHVPSSVFDFDPPPEALVMEGDFELREAGSYCLMDVGGFRGPDQLMPDDTWRVSSSSAAHRSTPEFAIDGDDDTCWMGRGRAHLQEPGMWFQIDFEAPTRVSKMMVMHAPLGSGPTEGWPRGIQVSATADGVTWEDVYTGAADADSPAFAYFGSSETAPEVIGIRMTLTESSDEEPWIVTEIRLDGRPM